MKIAILGYASQGQAAYEYWNTPGNEITICDTNLDAPVPEGVASQLGNDYLKNLDQYDLLIRTPALHPKQIVEENSPLILEKVTTVSDEFLRVCPSKNIIGVTGTKGKGTTSTLIAKILEAAGKTVHLGGNIGIPPLNMLKDGIQPDDWVVLELANFQLIDIKHSPHIGVVLMMAREHLNWHENMEEYVTAKQQMFRWQTPEDLAIFNRNNAFSEDVASVSPAAKLSYEVPGPGAEPHKKLGAYVQGNRIYMNDTEICSTEEVALLGRHNLDNVCAAIAATWEIINHNTKPITDVVTTFNGLEHHIELVKTIGGVQYYDDSFGTTPETAIVAIQAFTEPKVVILGGSDKGVEFDELAHVVTANNVRAAILVGDTAPKIEEALRAAGFENIIPGGTDMQTMVTTAQDQAQAGDVVLLSTGCASFGLFQNYKDRGEQFKKVVLALPEPVSAAQ